MSVTEPGRTGVQAYEPVIGLEVHCELATATKLFCGCPNEFGAEPNTHVCPVCLGLPGSLPVLNEQAVEFALRFAEAVHLRVPEQSTFARKNYFYPDMPKDYQVSQYDEPITVDGWIDVDGGRVGIERAHLEEDTGKTSHVGGGGRIHEADHSLVDYNRAGVPLMEIVSRPDIRSAEQARAYVTELRGVLQAIGVSDVKMEEGSMRVDANVSVRPIGTSELGTKVEVKNMNSLRSLGRAIEYEIERQIGALESGERIVQETRHWDEADGRTHSMRTKEGSSDYRYFPEPDLVPVAPTDEMRDRVHGSMPELPANRRARLQEEWGISDNEARVLLGTPGLADYAEAAVDALDGGSPRDVVNWANGEVLGHLNESGLSPEVLPLAPDGLAELVGLVDAGLISRSQAKDVLGECLSEPKRPKQVVAERGLTQVSDAGAIGAVVDRVLAANADAVEGVPRRRRQGPQEEARFHHRRGHAGARGPGEPEGRQPAPRREARRRITVIPARFHCRMTAEKRTQSDNERELRRLATEQLGAVQSRTSVRGRADDRCDHPTGAQRQVGADPAARLRHHGRTVVESTIRDGCRPLGRRRGGRLARHRRCAVGYRGGARSADRALGAVTTPSSRGTARRPPRYAGRSSGPDGHRPDPGHHTDPHAHRPRRSVGGRPPARRDGERLRSEAGYP